MIQPPIDNTNRLSPMPTETLDERGSLTVLALLSLLAGAASGLIGALFRWALQQADQWRDALITWTHGNNLFSSRFLGCILVMALAAAACWLAAWLVRRFAPDATGSGIPHVEAVLNDKLPPAPYILLPVKFVGGLLAIGAGLALGREGPTVQMGASIAHLVGHLFRRNAADARILLAAGAGAGLATAFNAPIAGSVFVLEELMRRFDTRITIATLGASAAAISVSRLILGVAPDFSVAPLSYPTLESLPLFLVLGICLGLLGVGYNVAIVGALAAADRLRSIRVEVRAAAVGAAVGLLAWFVPEWVGGGDNITQRTLNGEVLLATLPVVFALRFVLGAASYSAGTPGGLFAPLLVLGAQSGLFFGTLANNWLPSAAISPTAFAVTGMAAFFTAVVRAPVTGIILVIELTSSDSQLLSMIAACFTAMLIPTLVGNPPIYDSLGRNGQAHAGVDAD
ncbi:MAG: H(+)/Cl(-) exchange transporter ClcA [Pirellulales bacterium]